MRRLGEQTKLGDLFLFKNGRAFKKEEWSTKGVPIIRIQNLNRKDATFNYFAGNYDDDILVEQGDLLFSWSGTVGSSFGPHLWEGQDAVLNQHIFKIGFRQNIDKRYAFHALRHITAAIEASVNGAVGLVHITKEKLNQFTIPVPRMPEQKRIVSILDEAFGGIAKAKANAEKNIENARALFESHRQAIFSNIGKDCVQKKLGAIANVQSGGTPLVSEKSYWGGAIPWYSSGELNATFTTSPERCITKTGLNNSNAKLFPKGSLLIGMYDTAALKMSILDRDATFNQAVAGVKPSDQFEAEFILHAIDAIKSRLLLERRGVRQKNLSLGKIKDIALPMPNVEQQKAVVARLRIVLAETQRLGNLYQRRSAALDDLEKSLLNQAFTGSL
jgi:type I restriction enzyme, S subunit